MQTATIIRVNVMSVFLNLSGRERNNCKKANEKLMNRNLLRVVRKIYIWRIIQTNCNCRCNWKVVAVEIDMI